MTFVKEEKPEMEKLTNNPYLGDKKSNILEALFFQKNRASSLFYIYLSLRTRFKKMTKIGHFEKLPSQFAHM